MWSRDLGISWTSLSFLRHNNFQLTKTITWLWRWLPYRLSQRQSLTTVLLRTPITQMIFYNKGIMTLLLGSNLFLICQFHIVVVVVFVNQSWFVIAETINSIGQCDVLLFGSNTNEELVKSYDTYLRIWRKNVNERNHFRSNAINKKVTKRLSMLCNVSGQNWMNQLN